MHAPLVPARLAFASDGTPYSAAFDDIYHSSHGGPAQAQHVFLDGNGLPSRWSGRARFTILETGFGLGLNFLATWAAWRDDPDHATRLHYVAVEKHPFCARDLAQLHSRHAQFAVQSAQLRAAWPLLVPGMHRLEFEDGRVVLTLLFAAIDVALPQLRLAADAIYLDGFAPAKNPDMWTPRVLKAVGRLAATEATLATYTSASAVRESLGAAGFEVEKRRGFAHKREMTCARFRLVRPAPAAPRREAIVIGAGLAGSAVCERLTARGWAVTLIEKRGGPAQGASGNHSGAFHPLVTADDSHLARLSRASFLYALRHWPAQAGVEWARCGVLQIARHADEEAAQQTALAHHKYPDDYARYLAREPAQIAAGIAVAAGGVWFEQGGWIRPASLVRALLDASAVQLRYGIEVAGLERRADLWRAVDANGDTVAEAPAVVLANAADAARLVPIAGLTLRRVRGQLTYLPASKLPSYAPVLLRGGVLLPPVDGIAVAGASYDLDDEDPEPRVDSHAGNLRRLAAILPHVRFAFDPAALDGRVGFRAVAVDRMPIVGPIDDGETPAGLYTACAYASRGIVWCSLMAELLASRMEGDPLPIEAKLADSVSPQRFGTRTGRSRA